VVAPKRIAPRKKKAAAREGMRDSPPGSVRIGFTSRLSCTREKAGSPRPAGKDIMGAAHDQSNEQQSSAVSCSREAWARRRPMFCVAPPPQTERRGRTAAWDAERPDVRTHAERGYEGNHPHNRPIRLTPPCRRHYNGAFKSSTGTLVWVMRRIA